MKANELRVGNWFNEFGIPKQVTPNLILKLYQIEIAGKVAIDISPIPLTPEILVKAGFDKQQTIVGMNDGFDYAIGFNPVTYNHILLINSNRCGEFFYQNIHHQIKYVHQLQNLYFCLTGKELNIEL
jgi:hypothetical protein